MAETVIDGWKCEAFGDYRCAERKGYRVSADGEGLDWNEEHCGYSGASGSGGVTAAVLAWLIRPLLHEAWEQGHTVGVGHFRGDTRRNPYEDPTNG